ncbi:hypothetical protein NDU88_008233 [Pleurodeles waltl]|uniref:Uncharacterized protein n=1 Tax=Pleurodeles waltl TaxID=8319 RepID=A0AAV7N6G8_PLEWA|nr:hypothetical protein NDU88_008233 [Pleurodeles waltl]
MFVHPPPGFSLLSKFRSPVLLLVTPPSASSLLSAFSSVLFPARKPPGSSFDAGSSRGFAVNSFGAGLVPAAPAQVVFTDGPHRWNLRDKKTIYRKREKNKKPVLEGWRLGDQKTIYRKRKKNKKPVLEGTLVYRG